MKPELIRFKKIKNLSKQNIASKERVDQFIEELKKEKNIQKDVAKIFKGVLDAR